MSFAWLKRFMPRGLYGRAALILLVPIVGLQILVSIVFIQRHFEDVTQQMTRGIVRDLDHLLNEVAETNSPAEALRHTADLRRDLGLAVTLPVPDPLPRGTARRVFYDISGRTVIATLRDQIAPLRSVDLASSSRDVTLQIDTDLGPLEVEFSRRLVAASNPHQFLVIMGFFGLLMTGVAFVYLRNQLRPIKRLAAAAQAFGEGRKMTYRPAGAREVRAAGAAFLDMRDRIERQIEQRTQMLSGISHDLRTPLTRLRLGLSMLPADIAEQAEIDAMAHDVSEMEALIDAFLQFAQSEAEAPPVPTDIEALAIRAVEKAQRAGGAVRFVGGAVGPPLPVRTLSLERALGNLISNATRYAGRAEVAIEREGTALRLCVEDDGPGIPPDQRTLALRPFARLDSARNQDRGSGVGLGLSIAQEAAHAHGGRLDLEDSRRLGGLRACLVLPAPSAAPPTTRPVAGAPHGRETPRQDPLTP